jgi:pimeloyl-ACP methyl ester carboxylesterase
VVGHDTGFIISYALAADHPHRVDRLVVAGVPRPPGSEPLSAPCSSLSRSTTGSGTSLSSRVNDELTEQLVSGREDIFFGYEFAMPRTTCRPWSFPARATGPRSKLPRRWWRR